MANGLTKDNPACSNEPRGKSVNNNNVIVSFALHRVDYSTGVEVEFDSDSLRELGVPVGSLFSAEWSAPDALEALALRQTLDDLQGLVWP